MYNIKVKAEFEAAHRLVGYVGKCCRLHGHNWTVEAEVTGKELNGLGLLVDFKELKQALNDTLGKWDHQYLNELPDFAGINPSAENMARLIYESLAPHDIFAAGAKLAAIRVWESPRSCVAYTPDEA